MNIGGTPFISEWKDDDVFANLTNHANVHNPRRMMAGWGKLNGFEAAVGVKNVIDAGLLELLARYRRAVCKITCSGVDFHGQSGEWTGTGFLVGPNLLVTNNHVLNSEAVAGTATIDFEFERSPEDLLTRKNVTRGARRALTLDPSRLFYTHPAEGGLDFTFVWVDDSVTRDYGFIPMSRASFAGRIYDPVFLIHHPGGDFKQVSVDDTELLNVDLDLLLYAADTEKGSSGAPVITRNGKLCGLHHAYSTDQWLIEKHAKRAKSLQDGQSYAVANEGIQFSAIAVHLENQLSQTNANRTAVLEILKQFNDTDTVTGPYGVLGRKLEQKPVPQGPNATAVRTGVIDAYNATHQDVDLAVWNVEWLNQHHNDSATLRQTAMVFADMTQDVWVLDGISRQTAQALQGEVKSVFDQDFGVVFSDDEGHPAQPVTALFFNPKAVAINRVPWPREVSDLWRIKARETLSLKTLTGPIFPSFPARFELEVLGGTSGYKLTLVPLFVGEHGNVTLRKAVAARIMTEIVEYMVSHTNVTNDWLIAGDANAPLQRTRIDAFEAAGILPLLARDPDRGGFSYLGHPDSILSQLFVPEGTQAVGNDVGMITTIAQAFGARSVEALTSRAPYGVRLSLLDQASAEDIKRTEQFLDAAVPPEHAAATFQSAQADWSWQGLGKPAFMRANVAPLQSLLVQTNTELRTAYGRTFAPLTLHDLFVLIYCEAGFKNGAMDPFAHHSLGERGLLPLPDNLDFWLGRPAPSHDTVLPITQNLTLYAAYLGQIKNRKVRSSSHGYLYRDLFYHNGIRGNAARQAKLLAGIIHGYFLGLNYRGGRVPDFDHLLAGFGADVPIDTMLRGSGYVHDGTSILANRQANVDSALRDMNAMGDLF